MIRVIIGLCILFKGYSLELLNVLNHKDRNQMIKTGVKVGLVLILHILLSTNHWNVATGMAMLLVVVALQKWCGNSIPGIEKNLKTTITVLIAGVFLVDFLFGGLMKWMIKGIFTFFMSPSRPPWLR